ALASSKARGLVESTAEGREELLAEGADLLEVQPAIRIDGVLAVRERLGGSANGVRSGSDPVPRREGPVDPGAVELAAERGLGSKRRGEVLVQGHRPIDAVDPNHELIEGAIAFGIEPEVRALANSGKIEVALRVLVETHDQSGREIRGWGPLGRHRPGDSVDR